jgi:hypothetical protein
MAKDEAKDEGEEDEGGGGGGGLVPLILGALSVVLNIAILVYLILFPAGGDSTMVEEMSSKITALHGEVIPGMSESISALAGVLLPGEDEGGDEEADEETYTEEDDAEAEYEEVAEEHVEEGGGLSEVTMMLTDTQLILRQLAENLNSDTASIKRSVRGASEAGKQVRNMRADLKRIEQKLNELMEGGHKKRKGGGSQFPEGVNQGISYP